MSKPELAAAIVGMVLLALVMASPVACTVNRQALVAKAIEGGAGPIAAKCAIEGEMGREPVCIAAAMRK